MPWVGFEPTVTASERPKRKHATARLPWLAWSSWWNENWQEKPKYLEKTCSSTTFLSQIPYALTWHQTWAVMVRSQQLTVWAIAWPYIVLSVCLGGRCGFLQSTRNTFSWMHVWKWRKCIYSETSSRRPSTIAPHKWTFIGGGL
jgi:hypothetical protein